MAITINYSTRVINIPQADLTFVSGSLYELDVNSFRQTLKDLEDDEKGVSFPDTHSHNTEVALAGVTYARTLEIVNGYTVEFEDGQYIVRCVNANHNISDVKVANQVSLIVGNAAGLIVAGSGVTQQDKDDIVSQVYSHADAGRVQSVDVDTIDDVAVASSAAAEIADGMLDRTDGVESGMTLRQWLRLGAALFFGKTSGFGSDKPKFRDMADTKNRISVTLEEPGGDRTSVTLDAS